MKKIYLLFIFLLMPTIVNAKAVFNICETCEYTNIDDILDIVSNGIRNNDPVLAINDDTNIYEEVEINFLDNREYEINSNNANYASSFATVEKLEINGFDSSKTKIHINNNVFLVALNLKISNIETIGDIGFAVGNFFPNSIPISEKSSIEINNVKIDSGIFFLLNNVNANIKNLDTNVLYTQTGNYDVGVGGTSNISIIDSKISKIGNMSIVKSNSTINVYSSDVNVDKYISLPAEELDDFSEYDIMDVADDESIANTYVHFDIKRNIKPMESFNFLDLFKNIKEDKNITYAVDNNDIAKVENNIVTALKEGTTNVVGTTDDGHIIYTINLVVEKETIPEKIDKMTIKVPITGSVVKEWVIGLIVLIVGVIGMCSYILIKRKK